MSDSHHVVSIRDPIAYEGEEDSTRTGNTFGIYNIYLIYIKKFLAIRNRIQFLRIVYT